LSGEVDTITDTAVGATVTYYGWAGIQPFVSVGMNLPTGETVLIGDQANARMDPNLVDIATFGEGFNIGPTVGFTLPITNNLFLTLSAGYTWRGSYDQATPLATSIPLVVFGDPTTPYSPGDVSTVTGSIGYQVGRWQFTGTGAFSREAETTEEGRVSNGITARCDAENPPDTNPCGGNAIELFPQLSASPRSITAFDPGDRYFASGVVSYDWGASGVTSVDASVSHTEKNEQVFLKSNLLLSESVASTYTQITSLAEEPFNSNSDFFHVGFQHLFALGNNFFIGPIGGWLYRRENGYPSGTVQYVPQQTRWSAGSVMRYTIGKMTLNARIEHVWLRTGATPAPNNERVSLLSSSSCQGEEEGSFSCDEVGATEGTIQDAFPATGEPSTFFSGWQGVIGLNIGF
jgi:hypothetical protein